MTIELIYAMPLLSKLWITAPLTQKYVSQFLYIECLVIREVKFEQDIDRDTNTQTNKQSQSYIQTKTGRQTGR